PPRRTPWPEAGDSSHNDDRAPPDDRRAVIGVSASPQRRTELGLVVLAIVITTGAYILASLGKTASLPANIVPFLVFIIALLAIAHIALRRLAPAADAVLLPVAGLLNGLGYVFIARLHKGLAGL